MKDCKCKVPVPDQSNALHCVNCGGRLPQFANKQPGNLAGRVRTMPRCLGCGTTVGEEDKEVPGGRVCPVCADKPQYAAPKASMQTGQQPTPAYQRPEYDGNFKPPVEEPQPPVPQVPS